MPRTASFNEGWDKDGWKSAKSEAKKGKAVNKKFDKVNRKEHERGIENWPPNPKYGE